MSINKCPEKVWRRSKGSVGKASRIARAFLDRIIGIDQEEQVWKEVQKLWENHIIR